MALYKTKQQVKIDKMTKKILINFRAIRSKMEQCAIEMKLRKAVQAKGYIKKPLQECITWGGPCTTADELCHILTQKPDQERVIVRTEMAFFCT